MNDLYRTYRREVPPSKWGLSAYPNIEERVIAWHKYLDANPSYYHNSPTIPDYDTWLRENGHTEEADRREDERRFGRRFADNDQKNKIKKG